MPPFVVDGAMTDSFAFQRKQLRHNIQALRNRLLTEERAELDRCLFDRVLALPLLQVAQSFFVYCSYQSEVATESLIDQLLFMGKTVCVPLTHPSTSTMEAIEIKSRQTDLAPGYRGIPEPLPSLRPGRVYPPDRLEVAFIPGSVFDKHGYRLGYGGGYYDRFLALAAPRTLRIGLAYSFQMIPQIPQLPHDVPMDLLVTDQECFTWSRDNISHGNTSFLTNH